MPRVRITFLSEAEMIGGAEHSLRTLLRHLDDRYRVEIVAADKTVGEFLAAQRPIERLRIAPAPRARHQLDRVARLVGTVIASRPDILHVNRTWAWARPIGILGGLVAPGARVVVVEHSQPHAAENRSQILTARWVAKRLGALVAVSNTSARGIEGYAGLPPGSVRTIHNGVEVVPRRDLRPPSTTPTIGAIGRLSPEKGYADLVSMLKLIDARVVLVGDGPERTRLEELAATRGVADRVEITGWQPDPGRFLATFDLLATPSRAEGSPPLSVLDAMMLGVPVLAADAGAISEAVEDESTGLLVAPEDPGGLAAAAARLLGDGALRARLVEGARARVEASFTAERMTGEVEALYGELLA